MNLLIFIFILLIVVCVHELGHFLAARRAKMLVKEFAFGFPPKIFSIKKGETKYSLNLLPLGGYVSILGEAVGEPIEKEYLGMEERTFGAKSKMAQAAVLVAGVVFNLIFGWLILVGGFMLGLPSSVERAEKYEVGLINQKTVIVGISENSPAKSAEIKIGSQINAVGLKNSQVLSNPTPKTFTDFVQKNSEQEIYLKISEAGIEREIFLLPKEGIIPEKKALGVSLAESGLLRLSLGDALKEGTLMSFNLVSQTFNGLFELIKRAFTKEANILDGLAGPVGIVSIVGEASAYGWPYLIFLTALLSLNLGILNILPLPALDGGRLFLLLIEVVRGKNLSNKTYFVTQSIGVIFLIFLMIAVTIKDIERLF